MKPFAGRSSAGGARRGRPSDGRSSILPLWYVSKRVQCQLTSLIETKPESAKIVINSPSFLLKLDDSFH